MENRKIQKAVQGDADAFEEVMRSQMQGMYRIAKSLLHNDEDAADAIQETWLACWYRREDLRDPAKFKSWLCRILTNKCMDILRSRKDMEPEELLQDIGRIENRYHMAEWEQVLSLLDEKYRIILLLYYVDGFRLCEIAGILGIPEGTAGTRLARGREKLQKIVLEKP